MTDGFKIKAEFDKATDVLIHNPFEEFFLSLMHFETSDFLRPFDRYKAAKEHDTFATEMKANSINIHYLKDILLKDCVDENGIAVEGKPLENLREMADSCQNYHYTQGLSRVEKKALNYHKEMTINTLNPFDLVKIIIERPTLKFTRDMSINDDDSKIKSSLKFEAQGNLCYTRDQQIVTDRGIVLGKHMNESRKYENSIIKFAYEKMGITPLYEVTGKGRLEGGDYIPAGDFTLIGEGLRTNKTGIEQLLKNEVFGFDEVVVVKDPYKDMNQMHLDTYFNIIGRNKAIILDQRMKEKHRPKIKVYKKKDNGFYELEKRKNDDFIEFITKEKRFDLYEVEYNEEKNFSVNVLCVNNNKVIGVDGICEGYYESMLKSGVDAKMLDFSNLTMAYGGPHCLTQVLRRVDYDR